MYKTIRDFLTIGELNLSLTTTYHEDYSNGVPVVNDTSTVKLQALVLISLSE